MKKIQNNFYIKYKDTYLYKQTNISYMYLTKLNENAYFLTKTNSNFKLSKLKDKYCFSDVFIKKIIKDFNLEIILDEDGDEMIKNHAVKYIKFTKFNSIYFDYSVKNKIKNILDR